jgi:hypothetical protein
MSPSPIAAGDMAMDMLVAFDAYATVPAANTASRTIAKRRISLSITRNASLISQHVHTQAVAPGDVAQECWKFSTDGQAAECPQRRAKALLGG